MKWSEKNDFWVLNIGNGKALQIKPKTQVNSDFRVKEIVQLRQDTSSIIKGISRGTHPEKWEIKKIEGDKITLESVGKMANGDKKIKTVSSKDIVRNITHNKPQNIENKTNTTDKTKS